jgi:hypothetical protein
MIFVSCFMRPNVGQQTPRPGLIATVLQQPFSNERSNHTRHRLGQEMPSSFNMVRSKGRLSPTTLW